MTARATVHPYVLLDPRLLSDPRAISLSAGAYALYARLLCYCSQYDCGGIVDGAVVNALCSNPADMAVFRSELEGRGLVDRDRAALIVVEFVRMGDGRL